MELSCARAGLWRGAEAEACDWSARGEGAGRGCGSGYCWRRRCVSCAESCVSGAAPGRLCGTGRWSWACRAEEEEARGFLLTATCSTRRTRTGPILCLAWVGAAFPCCAMPSDWPAGEGAGRLIGG